MRAQDSANKADTLVATALRARDGAKGVDSDCTDTLLPTFLHCNKGRPDGRKSAHTEMVTVEDIAVAGAFQTRGSNVDLGQDVTGTIGSNADRASGSAPCLATAAAVRRLTPRECERLQGFRDDYTRIPYGKKGPGSGWSADGPRYRALGNSMAVPCMAWIGRRIAAQEAEIQANRQSAAA